MSMGFMTTGNVRPSTSVICEQRRMPEQFSLPGFDPAPRRPQHAQRQARGGLRPDHTLFFAILPSAGDRARIDQAALALRSRHGSVGHPVKAARLHVTLHSLGGFLEEVPQDLIDAAMAVASGVAAAPFDIVFHSALSFAGSAAFVLRGDDAGTPLTAFRSELGVALRQAGLRAHPSNAAHMTLAYGDRDIPVQRMAPIRWTAEHFVLVDSLVGQGIHRHLGRWPLQARAPSATGQAPS
jgi:RNA 2',3'-cyclic 3'-phosphodiesterase